MAIIANQINNCQVLPVVDRELVEYIESLPTGYWDFVEYEKKYTHFIHTYPAMMIPPIPATILNTMTSLQPNIKNLLDPFMGSGTVLVEGILAGLNVWGIDLTRWLVCWQRLNARLFAQKYLKRLAGLFWKI